MTMFTSTNCAKYPLWYLIYVCRSMIQIPPYDQFKKGPGMTSCKNTIHLLCKYVSEYQSQIICHTSSYQETSTIFYSGSDDFLVSHNIEIWRQHSPTYVCHDSIQCIRLKTRIEIKLIANSSVHFLICLNP